MDFYVSALRLKKRVFETLIPEREAAMPKGINLMERHQPFLSRPYAALFITTLLLAAVDLGWGLKGRWSLLGHGTAMLLFVALASLVPLIVKRYRNDEKIQVMLVCASLFLLFSLTASFFDYLLVSTNEPLIDRTLAAWDHSLGFDWPEFYFWIKQRPHLAFAFAMAYSSVMPQIITKILYLSLTNRHEQLREFNVVLNIFYLITSVVSVYFPAAGPAKFYDEVVHADVSLLSHFEPLRDGTMRVFDVRAAQGLVSFPSFHAIMALLLAYAMRRTVVFPIFIILNIMVIVSTPTQGQHYLVELIAGMLTVITVISVFQYRAFSFIRLISDRALSFEPIDDKHRRNG